MVDAEEKANGNNVGSQEQKRELSPNLAQSSALAEAKRFQIATENLVNMNSTSSHYKQLPYTKLYSSKNEDNMLCSVVKTDNKVSIHQFP